MSICPSVRFLWKITPQNFSLHSRGRGTTVCNNITDIVKQLRNITRHFTRYIGLIRYIKIAGLVDLINEMIKMISEPQVLFSKDCFAGKGNICSLH